MSYNKLVTALLITPLLAFAQTRTEVRRDFVLENDTIFWQIPELGAKSFVLFSDWESGDKLNLHFSAEKPLTLVLATAKSQLAVASPKNNVKTICPVALSFQGQSKILNVSYVPPFSPSFSESYTSKKEGAVIIENTPVYELVNLAFALTEAGGRDKGTFNFSTDYFNEANKYFDPYKSHPLIVLLNKMYQPYSATYRMYRESAYNYAFKGNKIVVDGPYSNFEEGNTILDHLHLWEDFAEKSNFQKFYAAHRQFYNNEIEKATAYLPIKQMWQWCESKFPSEYQTYRIVISPLVNGFHSTQHINSPSFNECIMFICGASFYDRNKYSQKEIEGLYSGIVFTEIDHNYVNPVSDKYSGQLDKVFGQQGKWVAQGSQGEAYGSGTGYFNEYMTHALYLLYIKDNYSAKELVLIESDRISLMTRRGFPRFEAFYKFLSDLYKKPEYKTDLTATYPHLIKWAAEQ